MSPRARWIAAPGGVIGGRGYEILCNCRVAGAALSGVDDLNGRAPLCVCFDVAGEARVLLAGRAEDAEVVVTELEVCFLQEVVYVVCSVAGLPAVRRMTVARCVEARRIPPVVSVWAVTRRRRRTNSSIATDGRISICFTGCVKSTFYSVFTEGFVRVGGVRSTCKVLRGRLVGRSGGFGRRAGFYGLREESVVGNGPRPSG